MAGRKKGLGPVSVTNDDGEVVVLFDERQVNGFMADIFDHFHRLLRGHADFLDWLRDHPDHTEEDPLD